MAVSSVGLIRPPSITITTPSSPTSLSFKRCGYFNWRTQSELVCLGKIKDAEKAILGNLSVAVAAGTYQPCIWDYSFLQSLPAKTNAVPSHKERADELKDIIKRMLIDNKDMEPLALLEMIDDIDRLGLAYHFEKEIKTALNYIMSSTSDGTYDNNEDQSLEEVALKFWILRRYGYKVQQDVFNPFKDKDDNFEPRFCSSRKGILRLYEASFLGLEGEQTLDDAKTWSFHRLNQHQKEIGNKNVHGENIMLDEINHAFELPRHWRMNRAEARWYIENYQHHEESPIFTSLLELAKLDFNSVQSLHQKELSQLIRWDISASEQLPCNLRLCFIAVFNAVNSLAYRNLKDHGFDTLPYLKKAWISLCNAYMQEAENSKSGLRQTHKEYLKVACISIGTSVVLIHTYVSLQERFTTENLDHVTKDSNILMWVSMIVRFNDDLATSEAELEKGDILKFEECFMHETGLPEEAAREFMWKKIGETWRNFNKDWLDIDTRLPQSFVLLAINLGRVSHYIYHDGDGHGAPDEKDKDEAISLLVRPISIRDEHNSE